MEQRKEQQQALVDIAGDKFRADFTAGSLRLLSDSSRQLPFERMDSADLTGYHTFLYDPQGKEIYQLPTSLNRLPTPILYVEIPNQAFIDPVQLSRQAGFKDEEIDPAFFLRSATEHVARVAPRIRLMGDEFFLDLRKMALVDTINPHNMISMEDILVMSDNRLSVDYDHATRSINDPEIDDYDKDTTCIILLDPLEKLDPVGWHLLRSTKPDPVREMLHFNTDDMLKAARRNKPHNWEKRTETHRQSRRKR